MLALLASVAAEGEESSKAFFYISGIVLTVFAVAVSAVGIARHETFPPTPGAARAVMGIGAALVVLTMAAAVITG